MIDKKTFTLIVYSNKQLKDISSRGWAADILHEDLKIGIIAEDDITHDELGVNMCGEFNELKGSYWFSSGFASKIDRFGNTVSDNGMRLDGSCADWEDGFFAYNGSLGTNGVIKELKNKGFKAKRF